MTSISIAIKILLTLAVTSFVTYFLINNVEIKDIKNAPKYQKFLAIVFFIHCVLVPLAGVNLIWSFK